MNYNRYTIKEDHAVLHIISEDGTSIECLIDLSDLGRVKNFGCWNLVKRNEGHYYVLGVGDTGKTVFLNRFIMDAGNHEMVRYIDGNAFDNRRSNLVKRKTTRIKQHI